MLLIVEIVLTVTAWRKGWRGWALIPLGFALVLGIGIGVYLGASGNMQAAQSPALILIDLAAVVALAVMNIKAPGGGGMARENILADDERPTSHGGM